MDKPVKFSCKKRACLSCAQGKNNCIHYFFSKSEAKLTIENASNSYETIDTQSNQR